MPNRPESIVGNIGIEITADSSDAVRGSRRAASAVDRTADSVQELNNVSAESARNARRFSDSMQSMDASAISAERALGRQEGTMARLRRETVAAAAAAERYARSADQQVLVGRRAALARERRQQEEFLRRQVEQNDRLGRSARRTTGYLQRQLRALRDFFIRYVSIVGLFALPAVGIGLARVSITSGEDFLVRQRQLEALIGTYGDYAVAQQRVRDIADETRTSFQQTTETFETLFLQFQDLPFAIERTAQVTEGINLLFRGSAASAEEMSRAIVQLRQGFAKGVFSAQDVRILTEQVRLFDDFLRAAGLPVGQGLQADRLRTALAAGAGRTLLEQRAGAIDTRISVNAQRVADTFARVSAVALESSGFLNAVNLGLEYFESLLASGQFEEWLTDSYEYGTAMVSALAEAEPKILQFGETLVNVGFQMVAAMDIIVRTIADYATVIKYIIAGVVGAAVLGGVGGTVTRFFIQRGGIGGLTSLFTSTEGLKNILKSASGYLIGGAVAIALTRLIGEIIGARASRLAGTNTDDILRRIERFRTTGGLLTTQGSLRYSALDAEIRRRGLALEREEAAVIELTQAYRALDKVYRDVYNIDPALSFEQRLDKAVEEIGNVLKKNESQFVDTFNFFSDFLDSGLTIQRGDANFSRLLGIDLSGIDTSTDEGLNFASRIFNAVFPELFESVPIIAGERRKEFAGLIDEIVKYQETVNKGRESLRNAVKARDLFRQSLIDLLDAPQEWPIPAVDRRQFDALSDVIRGRYNELNSLLNQLDQRDLDRRFEEAVNRLNQSNISPEALAGPLASNRIDVQVQAIIRDLRARKRTEEIKALSSGDNSAVEAIQVQLDILNGERDVTEELAHALERQGEIDERLATALLHRNEEVVKLTDADKAYAEALKNYKNASGDRTEQQKELSRTRANRDALRVYITNLEESGRIADASTIAKYEKDVANIKRLVDLLLETEEVVFEMINIDGKIYLRLKEQFRQRLEDRREIGEQPLLTFDLVDVFGRRTLDQVLQYEQARNDLLARVGEIDNRTQASLEDAFFFRTELSGARFDLIAARRTGDSDAIAQATEQLRQLEDQLRATGGEVNVYRDAWIEARIAQLDIQDILQSITDRLSDIGRIAETAIRSLRDGFISLLDRAESFSDVLRGILVQLRNLAFDLIIFEPLERGLRGVLTRSFARSITVPDELRQRGPLGKPAFGGEVSDSGRINQNIYQTNVVPPDVAVRYQQQQAEFAVQQGYQLAQNPYASGL